MLIQLMTAAFTRLLLGWLVSSSMVEVRARGERCRLRVCSMGGPELKFRYISSYRDHYRVIVRFHGMYLSCRDPLAIIYRGVLIFFRVTVEIWYPLRGGAL